MSMHSQSFAIHETDSTPLFLSVWAPFPDQREEQCTFGTLEFLVWIKCMYSMCSRIFQIEFISNDSIDI